MISHRSWDFKKLFALLPPHVQEQAVKAFLLWSDNPWHPSLRFKEMSPGRWSARVGREHRVVGSKQPDGTIVWTWIGSHETYNKF